MLSQSRHFLLKLCNHRRIRPFLRSLLQAHHLMRIVYVKCHMSYSLEVYVKSHLVTPTTENRVARVQTIPKGNV